MQYADNIKRFERALGFCLKDYDAIKDKERFAEGIAVAIHELGVSGVLDSEIALRCFKVLRRR